jgi:hypothetical protein
MKAFRAHDKRGARLRWWSYWIGLISAVMFFIGAALAAYALRGSPGADTPY